MKFNDSVVGEKEGKKIGFLEFVFLKVEELCDDRVQSVVMGGLVEVNVDECCWS